MKTTALFRFAAAFAAAAGLFTALPAAAVFGESTRCEFSTHTVGNAGYAGQCRTFFPDATLGSNQPLDLLRLKNFFNTQGVSFEFAGTSNQANAGPFQSNPGPGPVGTLALDEAVTGFFALVLQSSFPDQDPTKPAVAASYGIYLFNGSSFGNRLPVISFDTYGIGDRSYKSAADTPLAFAGLFRQIGPSAVVPEPAGVALILTALGAFALVKRRRG